MYSRRSFLSIALASGALAGKDQKPMAGIFPIVQTPFTSDNKLDTKTLAAEIRFLDKTGAHGVVWPQLASEYADLTMNERLAGMEAVAGAGKGLKPAVVLGVQANDAATALKYTKHAEKLAPDALIALPPREEKDKAKILAYYKTIGENCSRPLFAQTIGDMSVDFVIQMATEVPNLRYIKDEAGQTLPRVSEYRRKNSPHIHGVFTGGHGKTLLDEMARGSAGTMPAVPFADLYVAVWDSWKAGRHAEAMDRFAKVMLLVTQITAYGLPSIKYLLELRGVFPNHVCRSAAKNSAFDDEAKQTLKQTMEYVRPLLRTT